MHADYMDYNKSMKLFKSSGFLYAEPLVAGTLQDVTNFPLGFDSTIPKRLGLPLLSSNIAEGVVIRPLSNTSVTTKKGEERVIFKRKVDGFRERKPRGQIQRIGSTQPIEYQVELKYEMLALITEQRVVNTVSKLGQPSENPAQSRTGPSWEDVETALVKDVMDELKLDKELWEKFNKMPKPSKSILMTEMKEDCNRTVEEYKCSIVGS